MSMATDRPKSRRWQALTLAALVLAGGSIAVPQAADAATTKSKHCDVFVKVCKLQIKVTKAGSASTRSIYFSSDFFLRTGSGGGMRYEVRDLTRGTTVCSGRFAYTNQRVWCNVRNRTSTISVNIYKPLIGGNLSARLY